MDQTEKVIPTVSSFLYKCQWFCSARGRSAPLRGKNFSLKGCCVCGVHVRLQPSANCVQKSAAACHHSPARLTSSSDDRRKGHSSILKGSPLRWWRDVDMLCSSPTPQRSTSKRAGPSLPPGNERSQTRKTLWDFYLCNVLQAPPAHDRDPPT